MNGFSNEYVLMCLLRLPESENDLNHSLQVNDWSPKCCTMGLKISWWRKWLVTFFTSIWLLSRMASYVSFKFGWLRKWFGTFFTNKWLLAWIVSEVCLKIVWHWESPWTIFTNEWFLSWMCWLRLPKSENDLKHSLQVNGLSPQLVLQWGLSSDDWENDLEHS